MAHHAAPCWDMRDHWPESLLRFGPGGREYHLQRWHTTTTVCGVPADDLPDRVGVMGVDLVLDDFAHRWLRGKTPCRTCFAAWPSILNGTFALAGEYSRRP